MQLWSLLALAICSASSSALALAVPATTTTTTTPTPHDSSWNKLQHKRMAEYKYFSEPGNDDYLGHYDARFFKGLVSNAERSQTLTHMTRAYLNFFSEAGLDTWIAHGTLLGWWWNGKNLPWDWDIDTQVLESTLIYIADHFNQTTVQYTSYNQKVKREYLLDVNPFARERDRGIGMNIIDARWIDTHTGLYIDITGLRKLHPDIEPNVWECKNFHKYQTEDLYPLRTTMFEGVPAKVPFKYDSILIDEYSARALTVTNFHDHTWDPALREWVPDSGEEAVKQEKDATADDGHQYEER